jgi:hypothetical protein
MRLKLTQLEATSPLDHNVEAVLPGVHTRLGAMETVMTEGFRVSEARFDNWEEKYAARDLVVNTMIRNSNSVAAQLVGIAANITGNLGGGGGGLSVFENSNSHFNSNSQQQAATAGASSMSEDALFEQAKRFLMAPRHLSLETMYFEWYGLEDSKDKPIVGGFERCEELFKASYRKGLNHGDSKRLSRIKRIMGAIKKKATTDGVDVVKVVDELAPIYDKTCGQSPARMDEWMLSNGMIEKGKSRVMPAKSTAD